MENARINMLCVLDKASLMNICFHLGTQVLDKTFRYVSKECQSIVDEIFESPALLAKVLINTYGNKAVVNACKMGDSGIDVLSYVIKYIGETISVLCNMNNIHWKCLKIAANNGHYFLVKYLLEIFQSNYGIYNRSPNRILICVIDKKHHSILRLFVRARVDIISKAEAIYMAVILNNTALVKEVFEDKVFVGKKEFVCGGSSWEAGIGDIRHNKELGVLCDLDILSGRSYNTIFNMAVNIGNVAIVKELIENGINVNNVTDGLILNPISRGNIDLVKLLLDNGIGLRCEFALKIAVIKKHTNIVMLLLEKGFDPYAKDAEVFKWASYIGCVDVLEILADKGMVSSVYSSLALRWAIEGRQNEAVKFLLEKGAVVNEQIMETAYIWFDEEIYNMLENGLKV